MRLPDLQPGTWADWANAAATTLAFTIALVLFVIGLRDRRRADEDRRRADIDRRSQQARRVWVWRAGWTGSHPDRSEPRRLLIDKASWRIENSSDDPITSCWIAIRDPESRRFPLRPLLATEVLRAGDTMKGELACNVETTQLGQSDPSPVLMLIFADAAGLKWERHSDGTLKEITGERRGRRPASASHNGSAEAVHDRREPAHKPALLPSIWPGQRPFSAPHLFERPLPPTAPG
jgi:hypothetical protein